MHISAIIATYGMERIDDTHQAIDSIIGLKDDDVDIIVVIDRNDELISDLQKCYGGKIRTVISETKGLSNARNLGVAEARGDIVAFIDDDAVVCPGWANHIRKVFSNHPSADALTGRIDPEWMQSGLDWLPRTLYWIVSCTYMDTGKNIRTVIGTNMAFRKEKLLELGGFHQKLGAIQKWKKVGGKWISKTGLVGEERDLCIRLLNSGGHIAYSREMAVKHKVYGFRLTMKNILERCYWEGYSKALISRMYRGDSMTLEQDYIFLLIRSIPGESGGIVRFRQAATICLSAMAVGIGFCMFSIKGSREQTAFWDG
jgi:cellulose synthase/poly-beta-1,6-N-acetylglucosamine synthase-like glycosyltransferase